MWFLQRHCLAQPWPEVEETFSKILTGALPAAFSPTTKTLPDINPTQWYFVTYQRFCVFLNKNRKKKTFGEFQCSIKIFLLSHTAAISINSWGFFGLAFFCLLPETLKTGHTVTTCLMSNMKSCFNPGYSCRWTNSVMTGALDVVIESCPIHHFEQDWHQSK